MNAQYVICDECGTRLKVTNDIGMKASKVKCPKCTVVVDISHLVWTSAERSKASSIGVPARSSRPLSQRSSSSSLFDEELSPRGTKACPHCGEDIQALALKCKHCGELCDTPKGSTLVALKTKSKEQVKPIEYVIAVLLSPIGLVLGVLWAMRQEPRAKRMLAVSGSSFSILAVAGFLLKPPPITGDFAENASASIPVENLVPLGKPAPVEKSAPVKKSAPVARKGNYVPLNLGSVASVVTTRGMFYDPDGPRGPLEQLNFDDWSPKTFEGVPFNLIDPQGDTVPNAIMLYSKQGTTPPMMPKTVTVACNSPAKAIHFLSGISGWGAKTQLEPQSLSMIVRLHYADGKTEDFPLRNAVHFADYIQRYDVPGSKFAFQVQDHQVRYFSIEPGRTEKITEIDLIKGSDDTAPVVMAMTLEGKK